MSLFVIEGCGDVGSTIAHQLFNYSQPVLITDHDRPAHLRRGMSFVDAYYQSSSQLEGVSAKYFESIPKLLPKEVIICSIELEQILDQCDVKVVINARMRKRDNPALPGWKSRYHSLLIGLGPGFISNINCDVAIETAWGDHLGNEAVGSTKPQDGEPRPIEGLTRERLVYAPTGGFWSTNKNLGDRVQAGDIVGNINDQIIKAPMAGSLRGISHHHAQIREGHKIIEIDPSGTSQIYGLGERPQKIAKGVIHALQKRGLL
jgi:xanthine dehydrogenase accessory factor